MSYPNDRFAADLIGDIAFRARYGGLCGTLQLIPLSALDAIELDALADGDVRVRDRLVAYWIPAGFFVPAIEVSVAIDSTTPTLYSESLLPWLVIPHRPGTHSLAPALNGPIRSSAILAAHRELGSTHVRGRISWPARIPQQWRRRLARSRGTFIEAS